MPSQQNIALLVKSLTKTEKRYFKMVTSMQEGSKYYLSLFDLLENDAIKLEDIKERFRKKHGAIVFDSACKHLYKVLMKSLRSYESENKIDLRLSNLYQEIKILYDKEIFDEFLFQVQKLKELSLASEKHMYYLQAASLEMEFYARKEFAGQTEEDLIEKQSAINGVLEHLLNIRSHSSLYELMLHRLIYKGVARSDEDKNRMNDLALAESQITGNPHYDSFESNKLHLLFQSVYFKIIGESELSLEVYQELDHLFEKNKTLWKDAPTYFIHLLEGIILNLFNANKQDAVPYFINRLKAIKKEMPALDAQLLPLLFQFEIFITLRQDDYKEALTVVEKYDKEIQKKYTDFTPNAKAKVLFYTSAAYLGASHYKIALSHLNKIFYLREKLLTPELFVAARLVRMIIHFEMHNLEYLEYDIRSLERSLQKKGRMYKTEKIMVNLFKKNINTTNTKTNYLSCIEALSKLENTPFEMQLSNVFNFVNWTQKKLADIPR